MTAKPTRYNEGERHSSNRFHTGDQLAETGPIQTTPSPQNSNRESAIRISSNLP